MKTKLTYSLNGLYVRRLTDLPAEFGVFDGAEFVLWERQIEHRGELVGQLCCDIIAEVEPPSRARDTLFALEENRLLLDDPIQEGLPQTSLGEGIIVDLQGNVKPNWIVNFELLPKAAKPWFRTIHKELSGRLQDFIKQLRWTQNIAGGHRPYSSVGLFWSQNGVNWSRFPSETDFRIRPSPSIEASKSACAKIAKIVNDGVCEPVSHDLIREAEELVRRAPRSALLVAFSALETSTKQQLVRLVPHAKDLVERMPSPSLVTLLQEVLPETIKGKGLASDHFPMKREAKDYLMKWVTQRNQVTHGVKHSVDADGVEEFVRFAKDILYLLDVSNGHDWALNHLECEIWFDDQKTKPDRKGRA